MITFHRSYMIFPFESIFHLFSKSFAVVAIVSIIMSMMDEMENYIGDNIQV